MKDGTQYPHRKDLDDRILYAVVTVEGRLRLNGTTVKASLEVGMPFVPGVATASDVELALALGCKLQKLFPADVLGGVKLLKAFAGPYGHTGVKFIPLGGVNAGNMGEYLALPIVAAIGGSWIVDKKLIVEKKWSEITALTKAALAIARPTGRI